VVGIAYKANIDDVRESPALDILELLAQRGARLSWFDPHVTELAGFDYAHRLGELDPSLLEEFDCALITTRHERVDHELLARHCRTVVDTRNALGGVRAEGIHRL
jgi:UDP-N-acetyl-D-glucosamine dehydrogenase